MKALVTGGGGFLGRYIVEQLQARGDEVTILGRRKYPELEAMGVAGMQCDLQDKKAVFRSCEGMDVVFHVAAHMGHWGQWATFYNINVQGTQNVLDACLAQGVGRLVYTSTPSVVFQHQDLCDANEDQPYATKFDSHYAHSKSLAEQLVLNANEVAGLKTVSLRPHLIWGPRDTHLVPGIFAQAKLGKLLAIGDRKNLVDVAYVENVADAHLLACDALSTNPNVAGKAYFIGQEEPVNLWDFIDLLLERAGLSKVKGRLPAKLAYGYAGMLEGLYRFLPLKGEPRVTRFLVGQMSRMQYFELSRARKDLGYVSKVSTEEGVDRLIRSLKSAE